MGKRAHLVVILLSFGVSLLLCAAAASAALNVRTDNGHYNLGDEVVASYDFSKDQDFSGLVKLSIFCTSFDLEFYTLPTNINAGQKQEVTVPPLKINTAMKGRCYLAANATSYDRLVNESSISNYFNVTDAMGISIDSLEPSYLPSDPVEVSGVVVKSHALSASIVMSLLGTAYTSTVSNNSFSYTIKLPKTIKSGSHSLSFSVNDSFGNSGSASLTFMVAAVPTRLVNSLTSHTVKPDEQFGVMVVLYDQADDAMTSPVNIRVTDALGSTVFSASNGTGVNITLAFPPGQPPGSYTLTLLSKGLTLSSPMVVDEVQSVTVSYSNGTVVLNNTGNVDYGGKFNITLSGKKTYVVAQDVAIGPGQSFEVDLSGAVSTGQYNISFPTVAEATPVPEVFVEDKRSVLKKASDAVGITGKNVKVVSKSPSYPGSGALLAFVLLVSAGLLGFYFIRNRGKGSVPKQRQSGIPEVHGERTPSAPARSMEMDEEARIRRILEEKRKQQAARAAEQPKNLRNDPVAQKFVKDIMKEKKFR